jgi:outer membrane protein
MTPLRHLPGTAMLLLAGAAGAQPADAGALPLWEVGLLGGGLSTPAYPGSDRRAGRALLAPFLLYRGPVLRVDRSGVDARLLRTRNTELDIGFALSLPAPSAGIPARRGMPDLDWLLEFGPRLKVELARFDADSAVRLELPLRAVFEPRGPRRQGLSLEPRLVYETGRAGLWGLDGNLGVMAANRPLHAYFYAVAPPYATPERPAYQAQPGLLLTRAGLSGWRRLGADWRVFALLRYDSYAGAANRASPLFRQDSGWSAGVGFTWTARRSAARAAP